MRVLFSKVQSLGNDFVLISQNEVPDARLPEFAKLACRRQFSVGADGLLVVGLGAEGLHVRMFNPDGTEDFCGNGLRCAAVWAHQRGWVAEAFTMYHRGLQVLAAVGPGGVAQTILPPASFDPAIVPTRLDAELFEGELNVLGETVRASSLSTGSTHTVLFVDSLPDDSAFLRFGPALEEHTAFPDRTSVIWAHASSEFDLHLRIWERGVGETQACGTGSSAAAVAWSRRLSRGGEFRVHNPGGTVEVTLDRWDSPIRLQAAAEIVFEGAIAF